METKLQTEKLKQDELSKVDTQTRNDQILRPQEKITEPKTTNSVDQSKEPKECSSQFNENAFENGQEEEFVAE